MIYNYICGNCEIKYSASIPIAEYNIPQPCVECGVKNDKIFEPTTNFILKGDGWAGKNMRVKAQMREKNKKLDARTNEMKRDAPNVSLVPNVGGERVDSWSDAQKLAQSKGKNTASYDSLVSKEKANK